MSSTTDAVQKFSGGVKQFGSALIADAAIITSKIADLAVTTAKLAADAVTTAKIADDAVTTAKILAANVTTAKIALLNITTALLADLAVTRAKMGLESLEFVLASPDSNQLVNTTVNFGLAGEAPSATEAERQRVALRAGNLKSMKVRTRVNTLDVNAVITVRINGVNSLMTVTVLAGVASILTDTRDIAIAEDDLISVQSVIGAGTGAADLQIELEGAYNNS